MSVRNVESTDRQKREIAYHREHAERHSEVRARPISAAILSNQRRWWNAFWETYRILRRRDIAGKKIMVPGCGFGEDAIKLALLGADVYAFDLSADILAIAIERADRNGASINVAVMPAEALAYDDNFFDGVLFMDILHHVDIPRAMKEVERVLKPGGFIIGNELYTHSRLQRVRNSGFVANFLYPRMVRSIYGTERPYITVDEHKIDENELSIICDHMRKDKCSLLPFLFLCNRLFTERHKILVQLDHILLRGLGPLGRLFCGRIVFEGTIAKA